MQYLHIVKWYSGIIRGPLPATNFLKALVMEVMSEEVTDGDWEIGDVELGGEVI